MIKTFGQQPTVAPEGTYRQIHFPEIMALDTETQESMLARKFSSLGAGTRDLPITIYYMDRQSEGGHVGSVAAGALHEVTIDPDTNKMSGKGWLIDNENGRAAALGVLSGAVRRNSADLGDIPAGGMTVTEVGSPYDPDFKLLVEFSRFNLIATTILGKSGFATSMAELPSELAAAMDSDEPIICDAPFDYSAHTDIEIMASMSTRPRWEYFNRVESDIPHPIVVDEPDENGWIPIYGHLAQWRKQHRDAAGNLKHPPRGYDGYMNHMKAKAVLTDNGWAAAGPITLLGGHVTLQEAANKIENVWADVHVSDGKHGPWVCGVMRPHIAQDEIEVYRARASQISGYWKGGVLRLICSVTAAGYPVTESEEHDALVASFNPEQEVSTSTPLHELISFEDLSEGAQERMRQWIEAGSKGDMLTAITSDTAASTFSGGYNLTLNNKPSDEDEQPEETDTEVDLSVEDDFAFRQRQRERQLALETEDV